MRLNIFFREPKIRLAIVSLIATFFIFFIRLIVYLNTGSLAVLADTFHSITDLTANIVAITSLFVASRPADREHLYGHEKAESIGTLGISILLIMIFVYILYESVHRVFSIEYMLEFTIWSSILIAITMIIDLWRARALSRGAILYGSTVLEADSIHYKSDLMATSSVLTLSIIGSLYTGFYIKYVDMIISIMIAGYIARSSLRLAKMSIDELMDKAPSDIIDLFRKTASKYNVNIKSVRARRSGSKIFLDAIVEMPSSISLRESHEIIDKIENEMRTQTKKYIDFIIHMEPRDETKDLIIKRIREITRTYKDVKKVHDIDVKTDEKGYHVRFHVEVDPKISVRDSEKIVEKLRHDLMKEFSKISSVMIHVEPLCIEERSVREIVKEVLNKDPELKSMIKIYSIKILSAEDKVLVDLVCGISENMRIDEAHKIIGRLEGVLKEALGDRYIVTISLVSKGSMEKL